MDRFLYGLINLAFLFMGAFIYYWGYRTATKPQTVIEKEYVPIPPAPVQDLKQVKKKEQEEEKLNTFFN